MDEFVAENSTTDHSESFQPLTRRTALMSLVGVAGASSFSSVVAGTGPNSTSSFDSSLQANIGTQTLADDFDYPTSELGSNGWTIDNGSFRTNNSHLLSSAGYRQQYYIYHEQPSAAGTFEFTGVQNSATFYGLSIYFISESPSSVDGSRGSLTSNGYQITFDQELFGDVFFRRRDPDQIGGEPSEQLIVANHGGDPHDLRPERDPETHAFTIFYDDEEKLTVEDDTFTESNYIVLKYGGPRGTQQIDEININGRQQVDLETVDEAIFSIPEAAVSINYNGFKNSIKNRLNAVDRHLSRQRYQPAVNILDSVDSMIVQHVNSGYDTTSAGVRSKSQVRRLLQSFRDRVKELSEETSPPRNGRGK